MKTGVAGLLLIKGFEGFCARPYLCPAGVPTIGYGSTRYPNGKKVTLKDKMVTEHEASVILESLLTEFEVGVMGCLKVQVNQNQFDALVSFAYNLGVGALKSSTLLKKINSKDPKAKLEFLKWNKAGKVVLEGLSRRRKAEMGLFEF